MFYLIRTFSYSSKFSGNNTRARMHEAENQRCIATMMTVFYNETAGGVWFDYHMDLERHNLNFYPSNLIPLFTGCYKFADEHKAWIRIAKYLKVKDSESLIQLVKRLFT